FSICVATAALKTGSNRSFIAYKPPHFASFCIALAASKTKINSLLAHPSGIAKALANCEACSALAPPRWRDVI
ncbi:MAG TPA: hypothetical protein DIW43_15925, partial [Spongiibacteraceae bacterium]|nr:hypothetical protein [Spongiibacteraceae bacterium]